MNLPAALQPYALALELAVLGVALSAAGACGWTLNGWRMGKEVAAVKAHESETVRQATAATLAQLKEARADAVALALKLSNIDRDGLAEVRRLEHENDDLRASVRAGSRVVRVNGAQCPQRAADVPQTAASGSVDTGGGAVLSAEAGQDVLDLRAAAIRVAGKLNACQAAVRSMTGQ